jgi:hypothetical protein
MFLHNKFLQYQRHFCEGGVHRYFKMSMHHRTYAFRKDCDHSDSAPCQSLLSGRTTKCVGVNVVPSIGASEGDVIGRNVHN